MTRIRALAAILALILALPAAVSGCGGDGGGGSEDPGEVLEQTFNNSTEITSGQLDISFDGSAEGAQPGSLTATIEGPFQTDENNAATIPQLDLSAELSASGAGQSLDLAGSLITTEDNAFVEYQGQAYEVGTSFFQRVQDRIERSVRQAEAKGGSEDSPSIFERLGIDPQGWLTNLSNEGDEDVEGTETIHIHGDADIEQMFSDLARIAQRVPGDAAPTLDQAQLDQVRDAIQEASLDVYSGKDDRVLRRLSASLTIDPPESAGGSEVDSVNLDLSVTLSDVNDPQEISAPQDAQPISGLLSDLGLPDLGLPERSGGTNGGVGGGGGPAPGYLDCIQNATTSDEIRECAAELQ